MFTTKKINMNIVYVILAIIIAMVLISYTNDEDKKPPFEKAFDDISDGIGNAADEFKDKTPVEKIGDAVEDAGQKIKDSAD